MEDKWKEEGEKQRAEDMVQGDAGRAEDVGENKAEDVGESKAEENGDQVEERRQEGEEFNSNFFAQMYVKCVNFLFENCFILIL